MDELYAICRTFEIDDNDARGFLSKRSAKTAKARRGRS